MFAPREVVRSFLKRRFRVDLVSITLGRSKPKPCQLRGNGTLEQRRGKLDLKVFLVEQDARRLCDEGVLDLHASGEAGRLMDLEELFTVEAEDLYGNRWTSANAVVNLSLSGNRAIASARLHEVWYCPAGVAAPQVTRKLKMWLGAAVSLPYRLFPSEGWIGRTMKGVPSCSELARFSAGTCKFEASDELGVTTFEIQSEETLSPLGVGDAVMQASCFLTGRAVAWAAAQFEHALVLRCNHASPKARMLPPLPHPHPAEETSQSWSLFGALFASALHSGRNWTPLGRASWRAAMDSEGTLETQALGLAAAIEHLCSTAFKGVSRPPASTQKAVEDACTLLEQLPEGKLRDRMVGALQQFRQERAGDVLAYLVSAGVITNEEVAAWRSLRNPFAHGAFMDPGEHQRTVDQLNRMTTLFHKLGFQILGYRGWFRNCGKRGWPKEQWTPVPAATAADPETAD